MHSFMTTNCAWFRPLGAPPVPGDVSRIARQPSSSDRHVALARQRQPPLAPKARQPSMPTSDDDDDDDEGDWTDSD